MEMHELTVSVTADFNFESQESLGLYDRSAASAFQNPIWLNAFYRLVAATKTCEPVIVEVRSARNGNLLAILPLVARNAQGTKIIDTSFPAVVDYACPLVDRKFASSANDDDWLQQKECADAVLS